MCVPHVEQLLNRVVAGDAQVTHSNAIVVYARTAEIVESCVASMAMEIKHVTEHILVTARGVPLVVVNFKIAAQKIHVIQIIRVYQMNVNVFLKNLFALATHRFYVIYLTAMALMLFSKPAFLSDRMGINVTRVPVSVILIPDHHTVQINVIKGIVT